MENKRKLGISKVEIIICICLYIFMMTSIFYFYIKLYNTHVSADVKEFGKQVITTSNEVIYSNDTIDELLSDEYFDNYEITFDVDENNITMKKDFEYENKVISYEIDLVQVSEEMHFDRDNFEIYNNVDVDEEVNVIDTTLETGGITDEEYSYFANTKYLATHKIIYNNDVHLTLETYTNKIKRD
ncbi:MAG: hypothetical protein ACK5LV_07590 [Lachnospirales bacterium]